MSRVVGIACDGAEDDAAVRIEVVERCRQLRTQEQGQYVGLVDARTIARGKIGGRRGDAAQLLMGQRQMNDLQPAEQHHHEKRQRQRELDERDAGAGDGKPGKLRNEDAGHRQMHRVVGVGASKLP